MVNFREIQFIAFAPMTIVGSQCFFFSYSCLEAHNIDAWWGHLLPVSTEDKVLRVHESR